MYFANKPEFYDCALVLLRRRIIGGYLIILRTGESTRLLCTRLAQDERRKESERASC